MQGLIRRFAVVSTALAISAAPLPVGADSTPRVATCSVHLQQLHGRDLVVRFVLAGSGWWPPARLTAGSRARPSAAPTGNVQVNCRAEDGSAQFPPSFQNETTISAYGSKVVWRADDLVPELLRSAQSLRYSVSTNGGRTSSRIGATSLANGFPPARRSIRHARRARELFYYASLAFTRRPDSLIGFTRWWPAPTSST